MDNTREKAVDTMLDGEEESLISVKEWSQEQKQQINKFQDMRRQLKEKLASLEEKELQKKTAKGTRPTTDFYGGICKIGKRETNGDRKGKTKSTTNRGGIDAKKLQMEREIMQQNREDEA